MSMRISYEQLVELAKKPLVEAEGSNFFAEFTKEYKRIKIEKAGYEVEEVYEIVKREFLKKHCPPIEFIGEGSSRAAYALDGGLCLKVAIKEAGIAQNRVEAKNLQTSRNCFPKFYKKSNGCAAILVECVTPCHDDYPEKDQQRMAESLKLKIDEPELAIAYVLEHLVKFIKDNSSGSMTLDKILKQISQNWNSSRFADELKVLNAILKPKNEAQKTIRELAEFTMTNYMNLIPDDLESLENWGFAIRNSSIVPIVLDAGFSEKVWERYY